MESQYIPGVFNYCDRWCERCSFTARCSLYSMDAVESSVPVTAGAEQQRFWDDLNRRLDRRKDLLAQIPQPNDDPITERERKFFEQERNRQQRKAESSELVEFARKYSEAAWEWLEVAQGLVRDMKIEEQILAGVSVELPNTAAEAGRMDEMLELIVRYESLITAKIARAIWGKIRGVPDPIADLPRDYNGSAKVALIAIDRSINAWQKLREIVPTEQVVMLDVLLRLGKLRKATETRFPDARAFERPGFDTHDVAQTDADVA